MSRLKLASCLAVLAAWSAPATAQWAVVDYDSSEPVITEGFLVLHENPDVRVFSAAARQWRTIAAPGSAVLGTGDWTVLVQDADHYVGYSGRRNDTALLDPTGTQVYAAVHDDVALVIEVPMFAPAVAHGYSAVTNTWSTVVLANVPDEYDVVLSRFVIGIRDDAAYYGFAARTGTWATMPTTQPSGQPMAQGNVLLADLDGPAPGSADQVLAAFSGVRGNWTISTTHLGDENKILLGANVAYTRGKVGPGTMRFRALGYSAFEGKWIPSPTVRWVSGAYEAVQDNVVLVGSPGDVERGFEGFGSEPATWARLEGPSWSVLVHAESYAILRDGAGTELQGFSGLAGGTWKMQPIPDYPTFVGTGDHNGVIQVDDDVHVFMPNKNVWATPMTLMDSAVVTDEDALVDVRDVFFLACAARGGEWKTGPVVPNVPFDTHADGSVVVHQELTGDTAGLLHVFDERIGTWPAPFDPGGMYTIETGRNLVLAHAGSEECFGTAIWGYSVARGDWTAPDTFGVLTDVGVGDDVAWAVFDDSYLWAFGAPAEGHVYYDWPNGTEYHTSGALPGMANPFVAYGVTAELGDLIWGLVAPKGAAPPYFIPGVQGDLWLNPLQVISLGYWGTIGQDGLLEQIFDLTSPLPPNVELVFQPLIYEVDSSTLRFGDRCDPGWFF